ncbi:cupin domain-containing protein [Demequina sp. SYSU T00039]|uniref:Cupin domain-containing protein n=1 Tax=Demequina lignilytica TaxID=3051663 RepID=A0AAW7M140_9MICO|nr:MULTISPECIES: cupin domain-containing protein [unclassified Demequina]MDN4477590.1 cupin domain-containing protein [Demequina sp. SYSU T00039-1]MDN4488059.1 cupin domain-containing protein [Demequina sp. SYSU T00039]MDN4490499.1 cupin domain-containing protein [Demequina sp. SYSU T00068]
MTVPETAAALHLEPHPEGGWFRRTYTSEIPVATAGGERPAATLIHYLLAPGEHSAWHVVSSDEIWLWHGPGRLELSLGGRGAEPDEEATRIVLGPAPLDDEAAQGIVPAGTWQAARLLDDAECLVSCMVSPGFSFADWRLAPPVD